MTLAAVAIRNAKPREKIYRLAAGDGLYLEDWPNGLRYAAKRPSALRRAEGRGKLETAK